VLKNADLTYYTDVKLDPENNIIDTIKQKFIDQLERYNHVSSPDLPGYNGVSGNVKAVINMGPVQPPQRIGKLSLYSRNNMEVLQQKCDELEAMGVFCKSEDVNVNVEYVNPSFLVRKPHKDDFRFVTAFSDVGRYAKPQTSLMPNVDATIRQVGQWKYIITSDLTKAYHQIPLAKESMKYCGIVTPFNPTQGGVVLAGQGAGGGIHPPYLYFAACCSRRTNTYIYNLQDISNHLAKSA